MIEDWHTLFMGIAATAAQKSKDESSQIGVCIVRDNRVLSLGFNGLPQRVYDPVDIERNRALPPYLWELRPDIMKRRERPEKYFWYEHAERNAIYNAAKEGIKIDGSEIYCACNIPCADCARGIIQAGIDKVWYLEVDNSKKWEEQAKRSKAMFMEAGVELFRFKKTLGIKLLRNGELITV